MRSEPIALAGRVVHAVVPAQVAGVVEGELLVHHLGQLDALALQQLVDHLGVRDDAVVAAELRVLVLDGVEAVRALGDDRLDALGVPGLDVHLGHRLVEVLVAAAAGELAPLQVSSLPRVANFTPPSVRIFATALDTFFIRSS